MFHLRKNQGWAGSSSWRAGRAALARLDHKGLAELEKWWDWAKQDGR